MRRANQDYEYFYLLSQKTGSKKLADSLVTQVVPKALWESPPPIHGSGDWRKHRKGELFPDDPKFTYMHAKWSHNPEDWIQARYRAFDLIEKGGK
jgi:hypothetical protein